MKRIYVLGLGLFSLSLVFGQEQQIQKLEKVKGIPEKTEETIKEIEAIPYFQPTALKSATALPEKVDNTVYKYFPPIILQRGGSCSQAAGTGCVLTYELNRLRNSSADRPENRMAYHYPWNFVNEGNDQGSWSFKGWNVIMSNGCPSLLEMNDETLPDSYHYRVWMDGYDNYFRAMHNQVAKHSKIDVSTMEGFQTLKQYLYDHGDGSATGGVVVFGALQENMKIKTIPAGEEQGGKHIITEFGKEGGHSMVFAGYNDNVGYDVNGDGKITNDKDITGDGVVDRKDWERGALLMVNSWGEAWQDRGKAYLMYRCLALGDGNGGIDPILYVVEPKNYEPLVTAKLKLKHDLRNDVRVYFTAAKSSEATGPEESIMFNVFNRQGGPHNMQGGSSETQKTIEIGLDLTPLVDKLGGEMGKVWVNIYTKGNGSGELLAFSVLDYSQDKENPEEYISGDQNVEIDRKLVLDLATTISTPVNAPLISKLDFTIAPNPIRENGSIEFTLEKASQVKVEVLDTEGRVVELVHQGRCQPGVNRINWNSYVVKPSGLYLCRIWVEGQLPVCKPVICL